MEKATKPKRVTTSPDIETAILMRSARRCPLCFHLDGDLSEKIGQIAHLDQDRSNRAEDNLAFMCIPHHSLYDSKTSQHKNFTLPEVKAMRKRLYEAIAANQHHKTVGQEQGKANAEEQHHKEHDRKIFADSEKILTDEQLESFIGQLLDDHSHNMRKFSPVREYEIFLSKRKNEFLNPEIKNLAMELSTKLKELLDWTISPFHIFPKEQKGPDYRLCMHPYWNSDRGGDWDAEKSRKYDEAAKKLHEMGNQVLESYDHYRKSVKLNLHI